MLNKFVILVIVLTLSVLSAGCINIDNVKITFYVDDQPVSTIDIGQDGSISVPADPVKAGYTFEGWYFDEGTWEKPVTISSLQDTELKSNINVYAYFVPIGGVMTPATPTPTTTTTCHVIFDTKGGSYVTDQSVVKGKLITAPSNPIKDNYVFSGWYTTDTYGHMWQFATDVVKSDMTLYAKWTSNTNSVYYLNGFEITPVYEFDGYYIDENNKLYLRYDIAKVSGTTVAVVTDTVQNSGGDSLSVSSSKSISDSITTSLEETISQSTGGSYSSTSGGSIAGGILWVQISGDYHDTSEQNWETTESTSESVSYTGSYVETETNEYSVDLSGYPNNGELYRYVIKADTIISETFVLDLVTNEKTVYYDSRIIDDSYRRVVEWCNGGENFEIPPSMTIDERMNSVDLSLFFESGVGTENDPYIVETTGQCLLIPMDQNKFYRLNNDINVSSYSWFDPDQYVSKIDLAGFTLKGNNGATITPGGNQLSQGSGTKDDPYHIYTANDFIEIYFNPTWYCILENDIDLSGQAIPGNIEFCGSLNGNGHSISGASISIGDYEYPSTQYYGLFAKNSGEIYDLTIKDFNFYSPTQHDGEWVNAGTVAGINKNRISNVKVLNTNVVCHRSGSSIGGIAGINEGTINDCSVSGGLIMGNGDGGGITGTNYNTITSCDVTGNGVNSDHFMYFYSVESSEGENCDHSRSWGGIAGYSPSGAKLTGAMSVNNLLIYCNFKDHYDSGIGYIVGYNQGSISGSYSTSNVAEKKDLKDSKETLNNYFEGVNGYTGYNSGDVPW